MNEKEEVINITVASLDAKNIFEIAVAFNKTSASLLNQLT
jgi:hypothetical protein